MRLAVILPHRNRDVYKDFQKEYLPNYLSKQGIEHRVFFCEQQDNLLFSRAVAINVGFSFALENYAPDYVVVGDIDLVPLTVDYAYTNTSEVWFGNAGGVKVLTNEFIIANGYNNYFRGWGYEDSEFWYRLDVMGIKMIDWKYTAADGTTMVDLEMHAADSLEHSLGYFGGQTNVRFYHPKEVDVTRHVNTIYPKTWLTEDIKANNADLCVAIKSLPKQDAIPYFMRNGLNQINTKKVEVLSATNNCVEIAFKTLQVL